MSSLSDRRSTQSDRRKVVRGGRRPYDQAGLAPLVLVVGNGRDPQQESETILGRFGFAVAPATDVVHALRVVASVHPDLIVARPQEAAQLRAEGSVDVPIVEYETGGTAADGLIERLRLAIRK